MNTTALISAALLASFFSAPLLAGQHDEGQQRDAAHRRTLADKRSLQDMQVVPTRVSAQEAGHGWQFFSDPATHHAVAISPQGDYYFSRGKGLHWVAADLSGR